MFTFWHSYASMKVKNTPFCNLSRQNFIGSLTYITFTQRMVATNPELQVLKKFRSSSEKEKKIICRYLNVLMPTLQLQRNKVPNLPSSSWLHDYRGPWSYNNRVGPGCYRLRIQDYTVEGRSSYHFIRARNAYQNISLYHDTISVGTAHIAGPAGRDQITHCHCPPWSQPQDMW